MDLLKLSVVHNQVDVGAAAPSKLSRRGLQVMKQLLHFCFQIVCKCPTFPNLLTTFTPILLLFERENAKDLTEISILVTKKKSGITAPRDVVIVQRYQTVHFWNNLSSKLWRFSETFAPICSYQIWCFHVRN